MNAAKIVKSESDSDSGPVVLPLLGKTIREPRESSETHARAEIVALHNAGTDALGIGLAHDWDYLHGSDFSGTVAVGP